MPYGVMVYSDAIDEIRLFDFADGDSWGTCMSLWFAVADEIHFNREDLKVPDDWHFKPSPFGPTNEPDDYTTSIVTALDDDDLKKLGKLVHRWAAKLKVAGKDY